MPSPLRSDSPDRWKFLLALFLLIVGIVGIIAISMVYGLHGGRYPDSYGIVMDAGSSKTETLVYKWQGNKHKGTGCVERVEQIETCRANGGIAQMDPGNLDPVIDCTKKVANHLDSEVVPQTPLYFAATAGMRLLWFTNQIRANEILNQLKIRLKESGLAVKAVEIISGKDEGIYGWITANFLQKSLEIPQKRDPWEPTTYGALDWGGASTQISFALPEKNPRGTTLYGQTHNIFAHSILCFGRDQAHLRYRYFLAVQNPSATDVADPCLNKGHTVSIKGSDLFQGYCTDNTKFEDLKRSPNIVSQTFNFRGTSNPSQCQKFVSQLMDKALCREYGFKECFDVPLRNLSSYHGNQKYLAFAAFYFTTNFLNLTNVNLETYRRVMESWCLKDENQVKALWDSPYAFQKCFNVRFIYEMLVNGYGFNDNTWKNIKFVGNIAGKSVVWTLGYMINATNAVPELQKSEGLMSSAGLAISLIVFIVIVLGTIAFIMYMRRDRKR